MRTLATKQTAINQYNGFGNQLWDIAGTRPSLDLQFADRKDLVDATTGSNLVDHTRASSGTYVGGDGLIKTATTNLLLQSNGFDTTWANQNSSETATAGTAPDGTNTAWELRDTVDASNVVHFIQQTISATSGATYTLSIWAKAGTQPGVVLSFPATVFGSNITSRFDLQTGTVATAGAGTSNTITGFANGWYRVTSSLAATTTASGQFQIRIDNGTSGAYQGDGTGTILIWGAQLEQSDTVGEYVKTTSTINSAPRFDHDPTTGESLGLLVEESRTNILEYSEDLTTYTLRDVTRSFDSSSVNPTGSLGSYKILADSGLSTGGVRINEGLSSANNIVVSAFVKKSTHRYVYIGFGGTGNSFTALFDIEPGLTSNRLLGQDGKGIFTNIDAGYQNLPNNWIRIWAVGTTTGTDGPTVGMNPDATTFNITNWTAAGTEEIYAWGLQYEDNVSFPTSYIPTEGSTVTRAADVASITGTNFSSWYRQDEGSFFCSTFAPKGVVIFGTGDTFDNTQYANASSNNVLFRSGGASQATLSAPVSSTANTSLAMAYATNSFAAVSNGGSIATDSSGSVPANQVRLKLGSSAWDAGGSNIISGHLRRLVYFPTRLPNSTLQAITAN